MATGLDAPGTGDAADGGGLGPRGVRALKISIVVMSLMIAAGLLAIIGRIFYLASKPARPAVATMTSGTALSPQIRAELPAGAAIRSMALGGDRLAVHYDAVGTSGILIVDLATGTVASRVEFVPAPPRN